MIVYNSRSASFRRFELVQSDENLLDAVTNGDQNAYTELVHRYETMVRAVAIRILHNVHDAQDVAQESFIKAYQKLPTLRNNKTFGPWLMKITRRTALDTAKKKDCRPAMQPLDGYDMPSNKGRLTTKSETLLQAVMMCQPVHR